MANFGVRLYLLAALTNDSERDPDRLVPKSQEDSWQLTLATRLPYDLIVLRLQGTSLDSRTFLSNLPSLPVHSFFRIASQSDESPRSPLLPLHFLSPGVSLVKELVLNPILHLLLNDLSWRPEGPRPEGEAHLLGFQTDTENVWLPVREYPDNIKLPGSRREGGRKMTCFRNNRGIQKTGLLWTDVMHDTNWQLID